ncbi:hypothetical protein ABZ352_19030 [Streptomyces griseofuscus]|uniref:hypothetical protein n=1 Tax=Streptomyces griseofuscus TaxID=146922 RepID=UPI0033E47B9B
MHYTDDPLMDDARKEHRLLLEPVGTTRGLFGGEKTLYAAACAAGDWMDSSRYEDHAHMESFDHHMYELQLRLQAETEGAPSGEGDRPDEEA